MLFGFSLIDEVELCAVKALKEIGSKIGKKVIKRAKREEKRRIMSFFNGHGMC